MALSRVLITVPSLAAEFGGPVVKAQRLSAALREIGHEVSVIGVGSAAGCVGLPHLAGFHRTPIPAGLGPLPSLVGAADVVHLLGFRDPVGTAAAWFANRAAIPYFVEPAGMHRRRLRSLRLKAAFDRVFGERLLRDAAGIIATSHLEAAELRGDGVPQDRIRVRPNGVDLDGLDPPPERGALRRRLGIPDTARVALSLGRITAKKGLLDFARALAQIDGALGIVAGPDDGDGTLKRLLEERTYLDLEDRLSVLPEGLWGRDKAQAFADADVFCLASATENWGNAAVEAAAAGMPVVITDVCGAAEWLDGPSARVVPYGQVDVLARELTNLLRDRSAAMAAKLAAPRLRRELDWKTIAALQTDIYAGRAEGARGRARDGLT